MVRACVAVVLALFISSCGASIDPAMQAKINAAFSKSSSASWPGKGAFVQPMPYAVGQYVVFGVTTDGKRSVIRNSIVGHEESGWIIETVSTQETGETISQALVRGMEKVAESHNLDDMELVWIKSKVKDEAPQTVEGPALSFMQGMYKKSFAGFAVKFLGATDGGTVTVPAGTFTNTTKARSEVTFLLSTYTSDGWYHGGIPISGLVKSITNDGESVMELIEFGLSGATRSF
jgi:hypothetical protein